MRENSAERELNMIFPDIVWEILFVFMLAQVVIWVTWRVICLFKKTCHWKSCPYRQHYFESYGTSLPGLPCYKFPPTQEEIDKYNQKLDEILENLK